MKAIDKHPELLDFVYDVDVAVVFVRSQVIY